MVKKMNILLISRDENCETEVTDFLLKSRPTFSNSPTNNALTIAEYAYRGGPPTVIKGGGRDYLRVYYVIKCFNTIQTLHKIQCKYDAIILFLCDNNAENKLILEYIKSNNLIFLKESHSLTIIGSLNSSQEEDIIRQFKFEFIDYWIWNSKLAYNWSTHECSTSYLWTHINKNYYNTTRVSYMSEIILNSIIGLFGFFKKLVALLCSNVRVLSSEMETSNIQLLTLIRRGDLYRQEYKNLKDLLSQFNILNLSDFDRLLKKEIKQLATHLSQLAILCNEIVNFTGDLHTELFDNFCGLEEFKDLYYGELQKIGVENITDSVIHSLDAMSKLKFTGRYIKDVLGIEKINELKSYLKRHYTFKNIQIPEVKPNSEPEKRNQDIDIENRIGNIQLLKSLQKTIQEFTDELKQVRQVQEVVTKDIEEMKKKLNFVCNQLNQKNDESSSTSNKLLDY